MSFSRLLNKTKKGLSLSKKEVDSLAVKLGLISSISSLFIRLFLLIVLITLGIIIFIEIENEILKYFALFIIISLILFVTIYKNNKHKIIKYLEAIKEFYLKRFEEFQGVESIFLIHEYQRNGYLRKNLCIFFTDGYDFYIFDDLLKETPYPLPKKFSSSKNKKPYLKIFDAEFVNKAPVYFTLSEINNYGLYEPFNDFKERDSLGNDYRRYTFTIAKRELSNYCTIELKDKSVFKLSPEVIRILRKKASSKERV